VVSVMSLLSQSIAPPTAPFRPFSHPNEVFVGNLSYFCDEYHLYSLFNQYAHVTNVRIVRTDNHSRSLLFGFVAFRSAVEAKEITRLFDRNIFMGRKMK
jgi:RNA recognition motif-containing protein